MAKVKVEGNSQHGNQGTDHVFSEYPDSLENSEEYVLGGQAGCHVKESDPVVITSPDQQSNGIVDQIMPLTVFTDVATPLVKAISLFIILAGVIQFGYVVFAQEVVAAQVMSLASILVGALVVISAIDIFLRE